MYTAPRQCGRILKESQCPLLPKQRGRPLQKSHCPLLPSTKAVFSRRPTTHHMLQIPLAINIFVTLTMSENFFE